jgi:hypothetical protein
MGDGPERTHHRFNDGEQERAHHRLNDEPVFEIITEQIRVHKRDCREEIEKTIDTFKDTVKESHPTWKQVAYAIATLIGLGIGATWILSIQISNTKEAASINPKIIEKVIFTADKVADIDKSLKPKVDSINIEIVEKAMKKINSKVK